MSLVGIFNCRWSMDSRERVLLAVNHNESDRIPYDLGGMAQSGIHIEGYKKLRSFLGFNNDETKILNIITQAARIQQDINDKMNADTCIVYGNWANPDSVEIKEQDQYHVFYNNWGIGFRKPKNGGFYYDIFHNPLETEDGYSKIDNYKWPYPVDIVNYQTLEEEAEIAWNTGKATVLMGYCPGIFEMSCWLRGFEQYLIDLVVDVENAKKLLGKIMEIKSEYWIQSLKRIGKYINIISEADDIASQLSMLLSPELYRKTIKPFHKELFSAIKKAAPHVKILFHSCGAVRPIIPDLIEIGVDILNPVQFTAKGMKLMELKSEYGRELSFWGGGIDTQNVLTNGSKAEIEEQVKKNIEILAPGGGFIFSPVHIIQPNVPVGNIMIMREAVEKYEGY